MANARLEEAKKSHAHIWNRILDEWRASAEKATDGRPDYAWAEAKAVQEFAATLGADFAEET